MATFTIETARWQNQAPIGSIKMVPWLVLAATYIITTVLWRLLVGTGTIGTELWQDRMATGTIKMAHSLAQVEICTTKMDLLHLQAEASVQTSMKCCASSVGN